MTGKTVLFAWELGAGSGHLVAMRRMAQRLRAQGVRVVAAVTRLDSIAVLDDVISEIHRLPNWPAARAGAAQSTATLNDILVGAGLADSSVVHAMLAAWDRLYRTLNPALVVADFAPAASLAARHRLPLLLTGNGFTLPPHAMAAFPPLHQLSPQLYREDDSVAAINAALGKFGWHRLDRLPQLFEGDAHVVHTLPLLDPYAQLRGRPADGPLIDYVPRARTHDAWKVFVYVSNGVTVRDDLLRALRPVANRLRIVAPELADDARVELEHRGAHIFPSHVDLARLLPECRLVVHLGGNGLAAEAALAGVAQLVLSLHVEHDLTGAALERCGVGRRLAAYDPALDIAADTIRELIADDGLVHSAAEQGETLRENLVPGGAGDRFASEALRLLG
jgi:UDP:flavonoid glycosyltransferase YjiC (YdhE family)